VTETSSANTSTPAPAEAVEPAAIAEPVTASDAAARVRGQNQRLAAVAVGVIFFVLFATFATTIFIHYAGLHHSVLAPQ
jgi:hypothetical protein